MKRAAIDTRPPRVAAPERIVLATDPGACSSQALGRAAQLAGKWNAELISLTALDPVSVPDPATAWEQALHAARQTIDDVLPARNVKLTVQVTCNGDPVGAVRDMASAASPVLVVTGAEQAETAGQFLPGSMVESLASTLTQPLLVVRSPPERTYRRIVVTTDFSATSDHAWKIAREFFPECTATLFHAREIQLGDVLGDLPHERIAHDSGQKTGSEFLDADNGSPHRQADPVIMCGAVEEVLDRFVAQHEIDLVVIGAGSKSGINKLLLGDTASRLLGGLSCDVLVVTAPQLHDRTDRHRQD